MKDFIEQANGLYVPDKSLHLLAPPVFGIYVEIGAWDKAGKLFHQLREPSRSPVKQLLQIIHATLRYLDTAGCLDTGNVSRTIDCDITQLRANTGQNDDAYGIVIGSNATAVDITDYALNTQIAHGVAAGQMIHYGMNYDAAVTVADPDCTFDTWRNFSNNSGGGITVRETALYVLGAYPTSQSCYFCILRDVPVELVVPDGGGCYVKYTLQITE